MFAYGSRLGGGEILLRDAEPTEKFRMQVALDHDRFLGGTRELDDAIRMGRLRRSEGQSARKAIEIMGVLDDVMFEARAREGSPEQLGFPARSRSSLNRAR